MDGFRLWFIAALIAMLAASWAVLQLLLVRWTTYARHAGLAMWAAESGFRVRRPATTSLPSPLAAMSVAPVHVLTRGKITLVECLADNRVVRLLIADSPGTHAADAGALDPAQNPAWLPTQMGLAKFRDLLPPDRFVAAGSSRIAARNLALGTVPALVPPDVAVVVIGGPGGRILLDFSTRQFDGITLGRMIALADQIRSQLQRPA